MISDKEKNRIGYIDAMRGITMILVVFAHIETFSYGMVTITDSFWSCFFSSFRMPLFFFISGYVAFKSSSKWSRSLFFQNIKKRFLAQVIPTAVFLSLFLLLKGRPLSSIIELGPQEYWFTPVLFEIYLLYLGITFLTVITKPVIYDFLVLFFSLISTVLFFLSLKFFEINVCPILSIQNTCRFLSFFLLGTMVRKYSTKIHSVISKDCFLTLVIISYIILFILFQKSILIAYPIFHVVNYEFIIKIVGLITVYSIVFHYRYVFEKDSKWCCSLRSIGRHTLDIYMIHYFLLPSLPFMKVVFEFNQNILLEFLTTFCLSLLIVYFSIFISKIIRSSHFLGRVLFAAK